MTSAKRVLEIASKELKTREKPPGSDRVKYAVWYGMNGQPWCAMFVSWVFDRAGVSGYKHSYTPEGAERFREQGRWFRKNPKPGDLVYFNFPDDGLDRIQHVGFVEKVEGDVIHTIEGNTSRNSRGSQDRGIGVYRRKRREGIVGYGRPAYNGKPDKPESKFPKKAWFGKGDRGADVRRWQNDLVRWAKKLKDPPFSPRLVVVDGIFGADTDKATKAFQRHYDLKADGRVGKVTIRKMERVRK